jgi:hypothetical protein
LSTIFVDFIFVDFDKILDKFIYQVGISLGNYFLPTLPSWYGTLNYSPWCRSARAQDVMVLGANHSGLTSNWPPLPACGEGNMLHSLMSVQGGLLMHVIAILFIVGSRQ